MYRNTDVSAVMLLVFIQNKSSPSSKLVSSQRLCFWRLFPSAPKNQKTMGILERIKVIYQTVAVCVCVRVVRW